MTKPIPAAPAVMTTRFSLIWVTVLQGLVFHEFLLGS